MSLLLLHRHHATAAVFTRSLLERLLLQWMVLWRQICQLWALSSDLCMVDVTAASSLARV